MNEFKTIPGFEGYYQISKAGTVVSVGRKVYFINRWGQPCVRNTKTKLLYPKLESNGYLRQALSIDGTVKYHSIHRLVATTYIPNPENLPVINHKDGNKLNNTVENLEWCTILHNNNHAISLGLIPNAKKGKENTSSKAVYMWCSGIRHEFGSMGEASKFIGVSRSCILRSIQRGKEIFLGRFAGLKFTFK